MNTAVNTYASYADAMESLRIATRRKKTSRMHTNVQEPSQKEISGFKPITHSDMEIILPYLLSEPGRTTDFSYAGVLMWVDYFNYEYAIVCDTLFIKGLVEDNTSLPAFSLPIGQLPLGESIAMIRNYCKRHNLRPMLSAVPEYALPDFERHGIRDITPLDDWGDYLYDAKLLSTLSGKKLSKKRNHVNKFENLYPGSKTIPMTKDNVDLAMSFMDIADKEGDNSPLAIEERAMTRRVLEFLKEGDTHLKGAILMAGEETVAFTVGDTKRDTLFIHIEKASRKYEGSYEKINKDFARMICDSNPEIVYINREDDAGDEGLRLAKQSYHPVEILRKYNIGL